MSRYSVNVIFLYFKVRWENCSGKKKSRIHLSLGFPWVPWQPIAWLWKNTHIFSGGQRLMKLDLKHVPQHRKKPKFVTTWFFFKLEINLIWSHSTTTWTTFYSFLTPHPPRVDKNVFVQDPLFLNPKTSGNQKHKLFPNLCLKVKQHTEMKLGFLFY